MPTATNASLKNFNPYHVKYWPAWFVIGVLRLLVYLPFSCLMFFGKLTGLAMFFCCTRLRKTAQINIQLCFPELSKTQQSELLRKNFISYGIALYETALAWFGSQKRLKPLAHLHHMEHLQKAAKENKGVLILGIHFTTLELIGRLFSMHYEIAVVYRENKNPFLNYLILCALKKHYPHHFERRNLRGIVKALKQGKMIWYTPDIDGGRYDHLFAPFFNIPAATITIPTRLPSLTQSKTVLSSYYRRDDGTGYDLYVSPALENFPSENTEQDLARINLAIEQEIRKKPEQYLWSYKRFKTRPSGEKRFYSSGRNL